jgi:hypothetical protein
MSHVPIGRASLRSRCWFLAPGSWLLISVLFPLPAAAQSFAQKGFAEVRATGYPQESPRDDTQGVGEFLFRYEASGVLRPWLRVTGVVDLRGDSHDQTDTDWTPDWLDRGEQQPRVSIRRLNASAHHGPVTVEVGRQFIRWGKADVLNPTDRFAPRDFINVLDSDFLGLTGVRSIVERGGDTVDAVWVPLFTPSRVPLAGQRWAPQVDVPPGISVVDGGRHIPNGSQAGARWNHLGGGYEFSLSGYKGFNHLAGVDVQFNPLTLPPVATTTLVYPKIWMVGGDAAVPFSAFTLKGEAAWIGSSDGQSDEYALYVIQIERQTGEWLFVGGYAGEIVVHDRRTVAFAPDRGLTKAFIGRASYTIDTNRSVAAEAAVRQNLNGNWLRVEYSQASGQHVRVTVRGSWIRGEPDDFFGRYARNSNIVATVRYSF